jgi:hypothetical protein
MDTAIVIVLSSFFVVFSIFFLATLFLARRRNKRTERLMREMMEEYEQAYMRCPDDFLRDNIIEFQDYRWRNLDKNDEK